MDPLQEQEIEKVHHIYGDNQTKTPLTRSEKKGVFLLLVLYTIQGFPLGFFGQAIQLLLAEAGISMTQLAELSVVFYPFTFKFLLAPFQDAHYFKQFGKRKSYIVPIQYLMAILFILVSFKIDYLLAQKDIGMLIVYGFIGVFLSSMQDIAVDGWVLTIFESEEHVNIGSTCNSIGQLLGMLITNSLFIQINSLDFCNKFFYSTPGDKPLVTTKQFLQIIGILIALVTFIVHFFIPEREKQQIQLKGKSNQSKNEEQNKQNYGEQNKLITNDQNQLNKELQKSEENEEELNSVLDVLRKLRGFFTNRNLRFLIIFLLTQNIGVSPIFASFSVLLVQNGFPKEILSSVSTIIIPFNFIAAILSSKLIRPNKEMSAWRTAFLMNIIVVLIGFSIIKLYPVIDETKTSQLFFIVLTYQLVVTFVTTYKFIAQGGFFNRISDEDVGGSSLTTLNSFSNLGGQLSEQVSLVCISTLSFTPVFILGLAYSLIYIFSLQKKILSLQTIPKLQWNLEKLTPKKKL